ncbi:ABC transporter permease [Phormidium sp. FACHB-1136]|jgi:spermidine/putrescine transport system permease protein|uniref:ABC transporter permease n=1 Tax=Phormidium sp. FACHB-1136 TaxID=2692848 RepID=UPI0016858BA1|nr:ABC transporter permease [Phormidium sp. FACHB-1136]MBD2426187.1 ABC transporter permease [Phormidium sp. FACHB-1136]
MAESPLPSSPPSGQESHLSQTLAPRRWLGPVAMLGPAGLWLVLLLVFPTVLILEISLVPGLRLGQPAGGYGLGNYLQILQPVYLRVIGRSLAFALGSTLLCLGLGFPVAYWLALMSPKRWRNLLVVAFILPLWTSSLLRAYAWITILRPSGVLNTIFGVFGLPSQNWLNTPTAVLIGLTYSFLPYMVLILYASLEKLDIRLLEAAADLGANPRQQFWKITVPQTLPGIAAGCLLVFIAALGDFVVPTLLGGASSMNISRLIYNQFLGPTRAWGFGSALSMVLILAVSLAIALLLKYGDRSTVTETSQ